MALPQFKPEEIAIYPGEPIYNSLFYYELNFTYNDKVTEYMKDNVVAYDLSSGSLKLIFNMNEGISLGDMIYAAPFIYSMIIKTHNKNGDVIFVNEFLDVKYKDFNFKQDLRDDNICYLEITFNYTIGLPT